MNVSTNVTAHNVSVTDAAWSTSTSSYFTTTDHSNMFTFDIFLNFDDTFTVIADVIFVSAILCGICMTMVQCITHHRASYYNTDKPPFYHLLFFFISVGCTYSQILFTYYQFYKDGINWIDLLCALCIAIPFSISVTLCIVFVTYGRSMFSTLTPLRLNMRRYLTTSNKLCFIALTIISCGFYPAILLASSNLCHLRMFSFILDKTQKRSLQKYKLFVVTLLRDIPMLLIAVDFEIFRIRSVDDIASPHYYQEVLVLVVILLTLLSILLSFVMCIGILSWPKWCCYFCNFSSNEKLKMHIKTLEAVAHFSEQDIFNYVDVDDDAAEFQQQSLMFEFTLYHKDLSAHHQYIANTLKSVISSALAISPKSFEVFGMLFSKTKEFFDVDDDGSNHMINEQDRAYTVVRSLSFYLQLFLSKMLQYHEDKDIAEFADIKQKILAFATADAASSSSLSLISLNSSHFPATSSISSAFIFALSNALKLDGYNMNIAVKCIHYMPADHTALRVITASPKSVTGRTAMHQLPDSSPVTRSPHSHPLTEMGRIELPQRRQMSNSPHLTPTQTQTTPPTQPHATPPPESNQAVVTEQEEETKVNDHDHESRAASVTAQNVQSTADQSAPYYSRAPSALASSLVVPQGGAPGMHKMSISDSAMSDDIYLPFNPVDNEQDVAVIPRSTTPHGLLPMPPKTSAVIPVLSEAEESDDDDDDEKHSITEMDRKPRIKVTEMDEYEEYSAGIRIGVTITEDSQSLYASNLQGSTYKEIQQQLMMDSSEMDAAQQQFAE